MITFNYWSIQETSRSFTIFSPGIKNETDATTSKKPKNNLMRKQNEWIT